MKAALVLLLIVVALATGVPLVMGGVTCPTCPIGVANHVLLGMCGLLVASVGLYVLGTIRWLTGRRERVRLLLIGAALERPPRFVLG